MNNNIREMVLACSEESIDGPMYADYVDQVKFAKMIIDKCIKIVNTWSEDIPCSEGYDILPVYEIKKYFGVEE